MLLFSLSQDLRKFKLVYFCLDQKPFCQFWEGKKILKKMYFKFQKGKLRRACDAGEIQRFFGIELLKIFLIGKSFSKFSKKGQNPSTLRARL